jgi:hypothetical protein
MIGVESDIYIDPRRITPYIQTNTYATSTTTINNDGKQGKLWLISDHTHIATKSRSSSAIATFSELTGDQTTRVQSNGVNKGEMP